MKTKRVTTPRSKQTRVKGYDANGGHADALTEDDAVVGSYEASECEDADEVDSDALDEEDGGPGSGKKRKKPAQSPKKTKKNGNVPLKKRRRKQEDDGDEESDKLPQGLTVVGNVVRAPTEGRVPPGQISQNTLEFLKKLAKPDCNDREWFRLHELVFRQAEKEWKDWIETFTPILTEVDDQIPELPPKDVIHRIYRDVRFSNDKTPYKQEFSASFSRSGRKGIFAHFSPGRSLVAGGAWQPGKNELATMRHHILHNSSHLRNIISNPEFVKYFGDPSPHPKGERQSIFGHDDELKVAPKGIDKNHKDIDLLKLRSVAVVHYFLDSEVTATDFKEKVCQVIRVLRPLVHCLNDMMTLPVDDEDENAE